jgi:hypothetical protein
MTNTTQIGCAARRTSSYELHWCEPETKALLPEPLAARLSLAETRSSSATDLTHLIFALAAHFEPAIMPQEGDPGHEEATLGSAMYKFVRELASGAEDRNEVLHFVSAREMVNIILAACDGKEGNPGEYRDYQLRRFRPSSADSHHAGRPK